MSKHLITHLRYVGIAMPDIERQLSFYRDVWGLTAVAGDTGVHFLAAEGSPEQYVVRLRKDDLKRQDLIAFGAASVADVDTLAGRLIEGGVRLSDTLWLPPTGNFIWFLRCNPQHHSFAVSRGPHVALHHASFEMRGIDEYMRGSGRMLRVGVEKVWGPGRRYAGDNTFSYFLDKAGNTVEYTTELELVDEDLWHPSVHDLTNPHLMDQWGTANPMNEFVAARSFNDPDRGLFVAPPL